MKKENNFFPEKTVNLFVIKMKAYPSLFFIAAANNIGYWKRGKYKLTTWDQSKCFNLDFELHQINTGLSVVKNEMLVFEES